jgi:hypothetical protein
MLSVGTRNLILEGRDYIEFFFFEWVIIIKVFKTE